MRRRRRGWGSRCSARCVPRTGSGCCTGISSPPTCCWRSPPGGSSSPTSVSRSSPGPRRSPSRGRSSDRRSTPHRSGCRATRPAPSPICGRSVCCCARPSAVNRRSVVIRWVASCTPSSRTRSARPRRQPRCCPSSWGFSSGTRSAGSVRRRRRSCCARTSRRARCRSSRRSTHPRAVTCRPRPRPGSRSPRRRPRPRPAAARRSCSPPSWSPRWPEREERPRCCCRTTGRAAEHRRRERRAVRSRAVRLRYVPHSHPPLPRSRIPR